MADTEKCVCHINGYRVKDSIARKELNEHKEDKENPHGVTIEQIGAAPAGYGLGEHKEIDSMYLYDTNKSGWYSYHKET